MKILSEYLIYWLGDLELRQFSLKMKKKSFKNRERRLGKLVEEKKLKNVTEKKLYEVFQLLKY